MKVLIITSAKKVLCSVLLVELWGIDQGKPIEEVGPIPVFLSQSYMFIHLDVQMIHTYQKFWN